MQKGFVYRLYPTKEQELLIKKTIGCSRFVYNHFLSIRQKTYQESSVRYWVCPKCKSIHDRDENTSKNILQQGLRELGIA